MGLIGVRVSTTLPNEGFTMTREDGWFDLMVNGGGPVMLQFGRNPYPPLRYKMYFISVWCNETKFKGNLMLMPLFHFKG